VREAAVLFAHAAGEPLITSPGEILTGQIFFNLEKGYVVLADPQSIYGGPPVLNLQYITPKSNASIVNMAIVVQDLADSLCLPGACFEKWQHV
jgi:hypothetical protein